MNLIKIDNSLGVPIYKQIVNSIYDGINSGVLKQADFLPSVNKIASQFSLARGSVFSAYNELKAAGIIDSVPGKGYFVISTQVEQKQNIFLLFSTFTPYKEILYNSFLKSLKGTCTVDIYFHHHNIKVFETLIKERAAYYNTYVIMPEIHEHTLEILNVLDKKKTYLLDIGLKEYGNQYTGIYQNFENDIFNIFKTHFEMFQKYSEIILVVPLKNKPKGIIKGFKKIMKFKGIQSYVIDTLQNYAIKKNACFIVIDDNDMVCIIKQANINGWKLGTHIGILSYNESELKSIIAEGVTTITTDFENMGKQMAEMILNSETGIIENPFLLVKRNSV